MKIAIVSSLIASAVAFAPSKQHVAQSTGLAAFKEEIGAQAPLGFFDPLGVMEGKDEAEFARLRALEVKHGRIAMLAVVGYLTTVSGVRWDAAIDYDGVMYSDMPSGFAALSALPPLGKLQVFLTVFFLEVGVMVDKTGEAEFDGDFRNGFDFGWDKQSDAWKTKKR
jgi:hypothetical protein